MKSESLRLITKTVFFTLLFPGTVTVIVPYLLVAHGSGDPWGLPGVWRFFGFVPFGLGLVFFIVCVWDFAAIGKGTPAPVAPPKNLVVRGPYRYVRNPMFVGMSLFLLGWAIVFESRELWVYALVMPVIFHLYVVFHEEPALRKRFGESYEDYCRSVGRWVPRFKFRCRD